MSMVSSAGIGSKAATCIRTLKIMAALAGITKLNIGRMITSCCDSISVHSELSEPASNTFRTKFPAYRVVVDEPRKSAMPDS